MIGPIYTTGPSDELNEVEEELIAKNREEDDDVELDGSNLKSIKAGNNSPSRSTHGKHDETNKEDSSSLQYYLKNSESLKVYIQALTLTFVAEWGDRSQIATIALASSKNIMGVIIGGLIGHAFCTGLAVVGGRMLASRISEKTVALVGGILFILFAIHSFIVGA